MDEVLSHALSALRDAELPLGVFSFSIVLDDCRIMKIGHIHIYITADAVDPAFVPMLPDAAAAGWIDGISVFSVVGRPEAVFLQ